jgi:hypothetical protein
VVLTKAPLLSLAVVVATALALLSVRIQRVGPQQVVYGNVCGPAASDLCFKPVLKGPPNVALQLAGELWKRRCAPAPV